jgi:hypothetical protein
MSFFTPSVTAAVLVIGAGVAQAATLPAGTSIPVRFETSHSSATSRPEERVVAAVRTDVRSGGQVVLPAGSELRGHVTSVRRSGRVKGRASLSLRFTEAVINGRTHQISTQRISLLAPATHKKDAAIIGGGTGAGAIIGAIADGKSGAVKGGLIGAGAGTGAVLGTRGKEVRVGTGSRWRVRLSQPFRGD